MLRLGLVGATTGTTASKASTRLRLAPVKSPKPASRALIRSSRRTSRKAMTTSASSAKQIGKTLVGVGRPKIETRGQLAVVLTRKQQRETPAFTLFAADLHSPAALRKASISAGINKAPIVAEPEKRTSATKSSRLGQPGPVQDTPRAVDGQLAIVGVDPVEFAVKAQHSAASLDTCHRVR